MSSTGKHDDDQQLKIAQGVDAIAALRDVLDQVAATRQLSDDHYRAIARAWAKGQTMIIALNQRMREMQRELNATRWLEEGSGNEA